MTPKFASFLNVCEISLRYAKEGTVYEDIQKQPGREGLLCSKLRWMVESFPKSP